MADIITRVSQFVAEVAEGDIYTSQKTRVSQFVVEIAKGDTLTAQKTRVSQFVGEIAYKATPQYGDNSKYIILEYLAIADVEIGDFDATIEGSANIVGYDEKLEGDFASTLVGSSKLEFVGSVTTSHSFGSTLVGTDKIQLNASTAAILTFEFELTSKLIFSGSAVVNGTASFSSILNQTSKIDFIGYTAANFDSTLLLATQLEVDAKANIEQSIEFDSTLFNNLAFAGTATDIKLINFGSALEYKISFSGVGELEDYFDAVVNTNDNVEGYITSSPTVTYSTDFDSILTGSLKILFSGSEVTTPESGNAILEGSSKIKFSGTTSLYEVDVSILKYYGNIYAAVEFNLERKVLFSGYGE